jgi:hypothetical protein
MGERTQQTASDDEPLMTFKAVARMLHSSHKRLKRAHAAGQLEAILIGRRWAIPRREAMRLLIEQGEK